MIGGVILAGGRSTRMGFPKALIDWDGTPLVVHVRDAVARATGGPVVVVKAPGQELPVEAIEDPEEGRGPVMGLAIGLAALGTERAFVCGTDQPWAHELLPGLMAVRAADVVAYIGQPLGAIYRTGLATIARERIDEDASLRGLLGAVDTEWLEGAPPELRSLNRPSDLE